MYGVLLACSGCAAGFLVYFALALIGVWFGIAMLIGLRRTRVSSTTCFQCGYDLNGLPDGAGCPECGVVHAGRDRPDGGYCWDREVLPVLRLAMWASLLILAFGVLTAQPLLQVEYDIRYGVGRINAYRAGYGASVVFPVFFAMLMPMAAGAPRPFAVRAILVLAAAACVLHVYSYTGAVWLARE